MLRKLLFPFSVVYYVIMTIRNWLYDIKFFSSTSFEMPIIAVGNLSVGGTGKTPMTEYIVRLLGQKYDTAILSRGYGRKTKGFVLVDGESTAQKIGDEPFQYAIKFPYVKVAVCESRVAGVNALQQLFPKNELVILDDAFQHRAIKAGFYVLLTAYDDLYIRDWLLPMGNLRESAAGAKRADVVVVTKCPVNLSVDEQNAIKRKLNFASDKVFFSTIEYADFVSNGKESIIRNELVVEFVAVAGIAKPQYFYETLGVASENAMTFPDHHPFSTQDIQSILDKAQGKKILTTEKDFMRLKGLIAEQQLYYLPIKTKFLNNGEQFDQLLQSFVANK